MTLGTKPAATSDFLPTYVLATLSECSPDMLLGWLSGTKNMLRRTAALLGSNRPVLNMTGSLNPNPLRRLS